MIKNLTGNRILTTGRVGGPSPMHGVTLRGRNTLGGGLFYPTTPAAFWLFDLRSATCPAGYHPDHRYQSYRHMVRSNLHNCFRTGSVDMPVNNQSDPAGKEADVDSTRAHRCPKTVDIKALTALVSQSINLLTRVNRPRVTTLIGSQQDDRADYGTYPGLWNQLWQGNLENH